MRYGCTERLMVPIGITFVPPEEVDLAGHLTFVIAETLKIWDPLTGAVSPAIANHSGHHTQVTLDLPQAGSCFVVFQKRGKAVRMINNPEPGKPQQTIPFTMPWKLAFPSGWGAPSSVQVNELKAWKDLDMAPEAQAFSGTATYTTTFDAGNIKSNTNFLLDLGRVEMIAVVSLNGKTDTYIMDSTLPG